MKNRELFDRTISILVKAYFENTLEHYNCYACAVGNLVAANCGYELVKTDNPHTEDYWAGHSGTLIFEPELKFEHILTQFTDKEEITSVIAKEHLEKTGYTFDQICKIEHAFEIPCNITWDNDRHMFEGLMSVCDCLMQIHEANETEVQEAKLLFVKV